MRICIFLSAILVVAALWIFGLRVPPAIAVTEGHELPLPPPPLALVCSSELFYQLQQDATLKRGGDYEKFVKGGVFTVNTDSGAVQGDVVVTEEKWKVVNRGGTASAAKLIAANLGDFVALTILVDEPDTSGLRDLYPFIYLDGRTGSVVTGRCRGSH